MLAPALTQIAGFPYRCSSNQLEPFDQGVVAISVVSATDPRFLEAGCGVKAPGGPVRSGHLQGGVAGASRLAMGQQTRQNPTTKTSAPIGRIHRYNGDVEFVEDEPTTGHGPKAVRPPDPESRSVRLGQFTLPLRLAPKASEGPPVEIEAIRQIRRPQRPDQVLPRLRS